ncbi:hypothetical protein PVL29_009265 [Vitis rotundifolia]|uniref:TF-B3 domain-containing protein n=1 Tax=Vitis rotundifolia TaxID=103349 RepID=A0AA38ZYE7_VITRO|nr:hypothetical protein PVL29_009265 [Vitis rotundifolia]
MAQKRDRSSSNGSTCEIKLDRSSSNRSASDVKQEQDGSEEGVGLDDEGPQTKKMGSSSSSSSSSSSEGSINGGSGQRNLLYKKSLTYADVYFGRLVIPLESATAFLPGPEKHDGRYKRILISLLDHKREVWTIGATFDELNNSYMLWWNWGKFVKKHRLEPEDVIFLYEDLSLQFWSIEYVRKLHEESLRPYKKRSLFRV